MAYKPPGRFSAQLTGSVPDQLRQVADALSRKADATTEPVYAAVQLIAPGGAVFRLTVDDTGALSTAPETRAARSARG
jgi:hypothetical protein